MEEGFDDIILKKVHPRDLIIEDYIDSLSEITSANSMIITEESFTSMQPNTQEGSVVMEDDIDSIVCSDDDIDVVNKPTNATDLKKEHHQIEAPLETVIDINYDLIPEKKVPSKKKNIVNKFSIIAVSTVMLFGGKWINDII